MNDKIVELNKRVEEVEKKMSSIVSSYEQAMTNLRNDLGNIIAEQREEIVKLRNDIETERQDRRNRRAKAIAQLKSE